jgi:hypothetical protein
VQVRPGRMARRCKARCARWRPVPTGDAHLHRQGGAGRGNAAAGRHRACAARRHGPRRWT